MQSHEEKICSDYLGDIKSVPFDNSVNKNIKKTKFLFAIAKMQNPVLKSTGEDGKQYNNGVIDSFI